jgi:uncharacterized protein YjlB
MTVDPKQIPPEVWMALIRNRFCTNEEAARAAVATMLNAWSGSWKGSMYDLPELRGSIILPLPQEARDGV